MLATVCVIVAGLLIALAPPPLVQLVSAQTGTCGDPEDPCSGTCCDDGMGGQICCDSAENCCNNGCCADECIDDGLDGEICCPAGQVACNGSCCEGECLADGSGGEVCCDEGQILCGGVCCDPDECCDTDDDGEADSCGFLCDSDDDGGDDACYLCDTNGNGNNDSCYLCNDGGEPGIYNACYLCDSDDDGQDDDCYLCDTDEDGVNDDCYVCDHGGEPGINDDCYRCDNDGDDAVDDCYRCDRDDNGVFEECYSHDTDTDMVKDSCCPDFRVELDFTDDFADRSRTRAGVEETGTLDVIPAPTDPVTYSSSDDTCVEITATGAWTAKDKACSAALCATINGCKNCETLTVTPPTGTRMTQNGNTIRHEQGMASAGLPLYYWLDPKDVSFSNVQFGEDQCPPTNVTGIYKTWPAPGGVGNHQQNTFGAILGGNINTGCRVATYDQAYTGSTGSWGTGGSFTWSIPTQWIGSNGQRHTFGSESVQVSTFYANGDARQTKQNVDSGRVLLNSPTVGWP